jgi:tRNA(Ile)-lysidine synthase
MNSKFIDFVKKYESEPIALAVSGGVDSMAMMHWHAECAAAAVVLHVNHHLRPASDAEAGHVAAEAERLGLRCEILHWAGEKPASGIEAAARKARYGLMLDWCRKNNVKVLMTAHQADDQIETFLMNLGRGSGVYGLGGIRAESMQGGVVIARPLLHAFRRELQNWCDSRGVKYFLDEMNEDEGFTRVRIRKSRRSAQSLLGISDERILLAIGNLGRAREALEEAVGHQLAAVGWKNGKVIFSAAQLFSLPRELRLKFLGKALKRASGSEYPPRLCKIERLLEKLSGDTMTTLSGCAIRRLGDRILITTEGGSISFKDKK